jgi:hypothetical protein
VKPSPELLESTSQRAEGIRPILFKTRDCSIGRLLIQMGEARS